MIRPFLDEEDAWCYLAVSVGVLLSFLGLVAACICSCRRNENKNEFLGLAGMVKLNNSETDGFNRIPMSDVAQVVTQDVVTDGGKRITSVNRSLPDIPKDKGREHEDTVESVPQIIYETNEAIGDHSELYATVQDAEQEQISNREGQEVREQDPLAQDISHQYKRFASPISNNSEHPYAQLQSVQKTEASQINRNNVNPGTSIEKPSTSSEQTEGNPVAPPRTRRSSSYNSLLNSESHCDIQAANAITGGVQANQDLPYMTPPLLMLSHPPQPQHNSQQHFSGDSQDSKGYTSISVREPLANIIAQTKAAYRQSHSARPITDPHYATVSDDSDEMYAAIDEQDKVYTSGSETYAQIQPMTSEVQRQTQHEQTVFCQGLSRPEDTHHAPQPPSVDSLRHVAHAHSRQASSSSATSSIINPGSPKPEKRQANSPLPPPPEVTTEGYACVEKKTKNDDSRSRSSLSVGKSLEDMYAKVMKKKREVEEQQQQQQQQQQHNEVLHPSSNNAPCYPEASACRKLSLVEISRASWCSHESVEIQKKELDFAHYAAASNIANNYHVNDSENVSSSRLSRPDADGYRQSRLIAAIAALSSNSADSNHEYEAVTSSNNDKRNSARRSPANSSDPNYEVLRPQCLQENEHYPSTSLQNTRNSADVYLVAYKHRQVSNASSEDPGYEKVRMRRRVELDQDTDSEPNYESMPHDPTEPNYASVCGRPGDSDTEPNYESVSHSDPNYESVKYVSVARNEDPPYEQVNNLLSYADGYEKVRDKTTINSDYEKINNSLERTSNRGDTDDEQYVQV